jgi:small subunit ribosomal protein S3
VGQKVNPIGFRIGVYRNWNSRWFSRGSYADSFFEDLKAMELIKKYVPEAEISNIEIEKTASSFKVIIHTARPGVVIGRKGQEIEHIKQMLCKALARENVEVSVVEIVRPELDALVVAQSIAQQLERRASYKKVMKRAASSALRSGAKGVKIRVAGRIGGAEIARDEWVRVGSTPLHTLRSDIDYGFAKAQTTYGVIGVKVWICRGDYQHVPKNA